MTHDAADPDLAEAEIALRGRHDSPARSVSQARSVLERQPVSPDARIVALWALGLAERELNQLDDAERHIRESIATAVRVGNHRRVAQVRSALVLVVGSRGQPEEALRLAAEIEPDIAPEDRSELAMRTALAFEQLGRLHDARLAYDDALRHVDDQHDAVLEARLRCNRGIVLAFQGETELALLDSARAEELATGQNQFFLAGGAAHNFGFIAGRQGDIVVALTAFARADSLYEKVGYPGRCEGVLALDRCEVLIVAGLNQEARDSAELAVRSLERINDVTDLAEARLWLARACLANGDSRDAHAIATTARDEFERSGRVGWAAIAGYVALHSAHAAAGNDGASGRDILRQTDTVALDLDRFGWRSEATSIRVASAEVAIRGGDHDFARRQLAAASTARSTGSPDHRSNAWLATAMLRRADGNNRGAKHAVTAGLRILSEHQATLGATDLRVGSTTHAGRLAQLGMEIALERRQPRDVLAWAERLRANALSIPRVRPHPDSGVADGLAELRRLRSTVEEARRAGTASDELESHLRRQEAVVRDLARRIDGHDQQRHEFDPRALARILGPDRELVEFIDAHGSLFAVVMSNNRCRLTELSPSSAVRDVLDSGLFSLARLARAGVSAASLRASEQALEESLSALDTLLIRPLGLESVHVVIVPTGALHNVPWCGLPTLINTSVSVAPSASRWRGSPARNAHRRDVVIATGPDLQWVQAEADAVSSEYRDAHVLTGEDATVADTLGLLDHADVAHVACHGRFRADSPMFSALLMFDGPLTVYDLEQLTTPPQTVVLPACSAAAAAVRTGDELIGTASALLGIGVTSVIAPITVISDATSVGVMKHLHHHLSAGHTPSTALAMTRGDAITDGNPQTVAAAIALLCLE